MRTRPHPIPPSPWMLIACLAAVYIIWGTTYFAIKVAITGVPPFLLVATRFLTAGGLLLGWQWLRGKPMPRPRQWLSAGIIGLLLLVAGNGSVTLAERWVSSGAAVALIAVMPLATALWSGLFGEWPHRLEWSAIVLGAVGAALMLTGRDLQASLAGTLIILGGVSCWSLGTVLSRRIDAPPGPSGFGAEMLVAGGVGLLISLALGERLHGPPPPRAVAAWLYLVVFGSIIAFSAYRYLVERVSATLAATYAYVNPPVGLLVGWSLGHESFSPQLLLGLPIVLAAVGLHAWVHTHLSASAAPARSRLSAQEGR
jgi:drug/metabolite transporter (DMT)-like permease